jgi:hypothetical protein
MRAAEAVDDEPDNDDVVERDLAVYDAITEVA